MSPAIGEQLDPSDVRVEVLGRLDTAEIRRVALLVERATEVDGVRPLSEHVSLHLRHGGDAPGRNLLLYLPDDRLAGYAHLDVTDKVEGASAELVVDPEMRRHGLGRLLVEHLRAETRDGRLRLWSHGNQPAAAALAASLGLRHSRSLWQMRRSLFARLPRPQLPQHLAVRTFRPGADDEAWVALNNAAFAGHPEQADWTLEDLHRRTAEPWFDPNGFFLAEQADGTLVGFHWTKVHGGVGSAHEHDDLPHAHGGHGHEPIGEVYVVGVHPSQRGTGLGRALTLIGLRHLRSLGLSEAMLYVDADNAPAITLYTALGFTHWDTDVMFRA